MARNYLLLVVLMFMALHSSKGDLFQIPSTIDVTDDGNLLITCDVQDGSGKELKLNVGQYVNVARSTYCYSCGPCFAQGMTCANLFRACNPGEDGVITGTGK